MFLLLETGPRGAGIIITYRLEGDDPPELRLEPELERLEPELERLELPELPELR